MVKGDSAKTGLKAGWIRKTVIIKEDKYKKLKILSAEKDIPIKTILDNILTKYFKK